MRILIGAPIHVCKDYSMERWLKNVAGLRLAFPADFLMVDNSPGPDYVEKIKGYCAKYGMRPTHNKQDVMCGVRDYKIEHLDIDQNLIADMRIEIAQETIRRHVLSRGYDAWFSWECDQLIPVDALNKLTGMMKVGNFMIVCHNSWDQGRKAPAIFDPDMGHALFAFDMGCTLISRECLEKNWFLPERGGKISLNTADRSSMMFKGRVFKNGGNYADIYGVIGPIEHLDK